MSKKGKTYLIIGLVVAAIQIVWIVPGLRDVLILFLNVLWKILAVLFGLAVSMVFPGLIQVWFKKDPWYVNLGATIPAWILAIGINTGLGYLIFMKLMPSVIESGDIYIISWITLGLFALFRLIAWGVDLGG